MLLHYIKFTILVFILFIDFWYKRILFTNGGYYRHPPNQEVFKANFTKYKSTNNFDSLVIPIKRVGRLMVVDAEVDGESGNMIFDTGATGIVLNKTYFRNHLVNNNSTSNGINGSVGTVDEITIDHLSISNLSFNKLFANAANLGQIENKRNIKIIGLFGFGLLHDFEVFIDINSGILVLYKIDKKGNRILTKKGSPPDVIQNIYTQRSIVFLTGVIAGKKLRFCLDTGAETNAISTNTPKAVLKSVTITRKSALNGVGSTTNQVLFGVMNDFIYGNTKLSGMETIITNLDYLNEVYDFHIDGILGYNFLIKGTICVNFVKNQLEMNFIKTGEI